jgi:hypothetical protein
MPRTARNNDLIQTQFDSECASRPLESLDHVAWELRQKAWVEVQGGSAGSKVGEPMRE